MKVCVLLFALTSLLPFMSIAYQDSGYASVEKALFDVKSEPTEFLAKYKENPDQAKLTAIDIESHVQNEKGHAGQNKIAQNYLKSKNKVNSDAASNHLGLEASDEGLAQANSFSEKYKDCDKTGACAASEPASLKDFQNVVQDLSVVSEATKEFPGNFEEDSAFIFKGRVMECGKDSVGFSNCCNSSGWGKWVAHCTQEENELGQAREKGLAVFVGTRKKTSKLKHKKFEVFCVFESKLARLVQEGGRFHQLFIHFGQPKEPNCRGISPSELARLDFDKINLNDAYTDITSNFKNVNSVDIAHNISNTVDKKRIESERNDA